MAAALRPTVPSSSCCPTPACSTPFQDLARLGDSDISVEFKGKILLSSEELHGAAASEGLARVHIDPALMRESVQDQSRRLDSVFFFLKKKRGKDISVGAGHMHCSCLRGHIGKKNPLDHQRTSGLPWESEGYLFE